MEMEPGKLFVGGISWDTNEDSLRDYFQSFGEIIEVVIMKDRTTGRARGFGFVVFADPFVAERVVQEKHMIDGRTVEAKKAVPRDDHHGSRNTGAMQSTPGSIRPKKIFVGGLASSVTESDFKKYFDQYGTITDVVVMYDHNTKRPRGFGFITYDSEEAVDMVLHKTFHELNGKMVEVKRVVPKELSPGPIRSPLGVYDFSSNRINNIFCAFAPSHNQNLFGSYELRMDRISPNVLGHNRNSLSNPSSYSMGILDSILSSNYKENGNEFNPSLDYGFNSTRLDSLKGYASRAIGNGYMMNSKVQNRLDNETLNYSSKSANFNDVVGLGGLEKIWSSFGSNNRGYGPYSGITASETSTFTTTKDFGSRNLDSLCGNGNGSFFEDQAWHSLYRELESYNYGPLRNGFGSAASGVIPKNSLGYAGAYNITNRLNTGVVA